jgi:hypothetical protein
MTDPFDSAKRTLSRAQGHIRDLEAKINAFVSEKPWSCVIEDEPGLGGQAIKIKFNRGLPEILPCIVFDAVNNLRSVLDQCGYAAALAGKVTDPKSAYFPFGDDIPGLDNVIKGRCKDVPPEIVKLFRSFSPYKGGNDSLWAMNKLCNSQKHCMLVPIGMKSASASFRGTISGKGWRSEITSLGDMGWDAAKNELTLCIVGGAGYKATQADIATNIEITVALDHIETQSGKPVVGVLDAMSTDVHLVLRDTEAECQRLGLV